LHLKVKSNYFLLQFFQEKKNFFGFRASQGGKRDLTASRLVSSQIASVDAIEGHCRAMKTVTLDVEKPKSENSS